MHTTPTPVPTASRAQRAIAAASLLASLLGLTACGGGGGTPVEEPPPADRRGVASVQPTARAAAAASAVAHTAAATQTAAPQASIASGVFGQAQFVELKAAPGATIRYTQDGSLPRADSPVYTQMLVIERTAVLRAAAFTGSGVASAVSTLTVVIDPSQTPASAAAATLFVTVAPQEPDTAAARLPAHLELLQAGRSLLTQDTDIAADATQALPALPAGAVAAGSPVMLYVNGRLAGLHTAPEAQNPRAQ